MVYDCVAVMPYSTRPLEDNSEGELDGESDADESEYGTESDGKIMDEMKMELD